VSGNQEMQRIPPAWHGLLIAMLIALAFGAVSGAVNGWAVGAYEDFILEQQARAREAPGGLKRYVWVRTFHFALPLAFGGYLAHRTMRRRTSTVGFALLPALLLGAFIGWFCAHAVGAWVAESWSPQIQRTLILPSVFFVAIPLISMIKNR